jgi:hypothetical protein
MIDMLQNYPDAALVTQPYLNQSPWAREQCVLLRAAYIAYKAKLKHLPVKHTPVHVGTGWSIADGMVLFCWLAQMIFEKRIEVMGGTTFFTFVVTHVHAERNLVGVFYSDGTIGELERSEFISIMDSQTQDACWACKLPGSESAGLYTCVECNRPSHIACVSPTNPGWQADAKAAVARDEKIECDSCRTRRQI